MIGPIRVLVADSNSLVRAGLRAVLSSEANIRVVGEATNGDQTLHLAQQLRPKVLIMEANLPGPPAAGLVGTVLEHCPDTRILIINGSQTEILVRGLLAAGVAGYLVKDTPHSDVAQAIRVVAASGTWLSQTDVEMLTKGAAQAESGKHALTKQELAVLRLMVSGAPDCEIGQTLAISERTVRRHLRNVYDKLGVEGRVAAAVRAVQLGLVDS